MALVMMQGHVFDALVVPASRADPLYMLQATLHGSTAPGFLFASGFVAGLPRAPLSLTASLRRAKRLLFVLGVGYAIHLPYFSLWKTLSATPAEKAALFACDALQVIAVTQLAVLAVQWVFGRYWPPVTATLAAIVLVAGPGIWASGVARRIPAPLGAFLDMSVTPSQFPVFPFAAFVLAGTVAGALLGRQDPRTRRVRGLAGGFGLIAAGLVLSVPLRWVVDFWGVSPAYALIRIGALLLILLGVEALSHRSRVVQPLALLGHETLLVYVLHLLMLYGGVVGVSPLARFFGTFTFLQATGVLLLMLPVVFAAAWMWHGVKSRAPHAASLVLLFLGIAFVYEFVTRPW
jgi:hypothetical protein